MQIADAVEGGGKCDDYKYSGSGYAAVSGTACTLPGVESRGSSSAVYPRGT